MMVEAKGLEWFIYNRSAAYDAIWERLNPKTPDARPPSSEAGGEFEKETGETGSTTLLPEHPGTVNANTYTPPNFEELLEESVYLKMLPIKIDLGKSAVVLGNSTTPSVLIAQMQAASGTIDAKKVYRNNIQFSNVIVTSLTVAGRSRCQSICINKFMISTLQNSTSRCVRTRNLRPRCTP